MRLLFSGRITKLETMNRILTDAARKRTERIEELESQVAELERQVAQLKQELEPARKAIERTRELEVVAAQRAHLLNEKDKELAAVREALNARYEFTSWNAPSPKLAGGDSTKLSEIAASLRYLRETFAMLITCDVPLRNMRGGPKTSSSAGITPSVWPGWIWLQFARSTAEKSW